CGQGAFLTAAAETFPNAERIVGLDINSDYLASAARRVGGSAPVVLEQADFFREDWPSRLAALPRPLLILGNPPSVTSAALGAIGGANLPGKSNAERWSGIEALTGRSNFDISEWMLRRYLDWLSGRHGAIAVLCKTSVARKILAYIGGASYPIRSAR